jgi:UDPglucose--hexose-1-phosphate uridylyltransferase
VSEDVLAHPHRRYNPLLDEWVLVSTGRTGRPWLGTLEPAQPDQLPSYDPTCYLCPGNVRANGEANPSYPSTFVFTNDFAALEPDTPIGEYRQGILRAEGEQGTCRVLCFSPRHDLDLAVMDPTDVRGVVDLWAEQSEELGRSYRWVQVFENRGAAMGASNPHPHGQIWAGTALPVEVAREDAAQRRHLESAGRPLLLDYLTEEHGGPRVVLEDDEWLIAVPFWAVWPFETIVVAKRPVERLAGLSDRERTGLAHNLVELLTRCDNLFAVAFPYSMGWHQAPYDSTPHDHWQLHAHVYPPLLRSASVRKFIAGYELLAERQRDLTAEEAAERLRSTSSVHYRAGTPARSD